METGGSHDQALSLAIRSGLERQLAIWIVNEALGKNEITLGVYRFRWKRNPKMIRSSQLISFELFKAD